MKNKFRFLGIVALIAIIGFAMASCIDKDRDLTIFVSNFSILYIQDSTVRVQVWGTDGSTPLNEKNADRGSTISFSMESGNYRVRVTDNSDRHYWYPSENSVEHMTGSVYLTYDGSSLTKP